MNKLKIKKINKGGSIVYLLKNKNNNNTLQIEECFEWIDCGGDPQSIGYIFSENIPENKRGYLIDILKHHQDGDVIEVEL